MTLLPPQQSPGRVVANEVPQAICRRDPGERFAAPGDITAGCSNCWGHSSLRTRAAVTPVKQREESTGSFKTVLIHGVKNHQDF